MSEDSFMMLSRNAVISPDTIITASSSAGYTDPENVANDQRADVWRSDGGDDEWLHFDFSQGDRRSSENDGKRRIEAFGLTGFVWFPDLEIKVQFSNTASDGDHTDWGTPDEEVTVEFDVDPGLYLNINDYLEDFNFVAQTIFRTLDEKADDYAYARIAFHNAGENPYGFFQMGVVAMGEAPGLPPANFDGTEYFPSPNTEEGIDVNFTIAYADQSSVTTGDAGQVASADRGKLAVVNVKFPSLTWRLEDPTDNDDRTGNKARSLMDELLAVKNFYGSGRPLFFCLGLNGQRSTFAFYGRLSVLPSFTYIPGTFRQYRAEMVISEVA